MNSKTSCEILAKVLAGHGVSDAVVSPGSRNTPLILALDDEPGIKLHTVIDERSAAFIALGMSQISRRPTVLCCTSGTALLNYAPAAAEAYYQGIPLIILSADRPEEWIDQDDSQTLRQFEALRNYVKASYDIPEFDFGNTAMQWYTNRIANDACLTAVTGHPGPVHVNLQFDNPLSEPRTSIGPQRIVADTGCHTVFPPSLMKELAEYAATRKVLIVAGGNPPGHRVNRAFAILSHIPNVAIWCETTANIHTPGTINCIDRTLLAIDTDNEKYTPELIISLGGALVSRMAKQFLRKASGAEHWSIGWRRDRLADPFMSLTRCIECTPDVFLPHFANALRRMQPSGTYADTWQEADMRGLGRHNDKLREAPWSALKAFSIILPRIPQRFNLQLSNGTAVRYAQLFNCRGIHACYCNRGVSGIDGSTSTAIGAASQYGHGTLLISGDMSFAYDIGALGTQFISPDMRIIVINNAGGEIFRFIGSTASLASREEYFSVRPVMNLGLLAEAYGMEYLHADSSKTLTERLALFFKPSLRPKVLEVTVPPDISARTLSDYFK
jgi:2-succinyl-5-enolpyruvyl-6-hydroxy-3-cyclohexene-1-carboxylate synthase